MGRIVLATLMDCATVSSSSVNPSGSTPPIKVKEDNHYPATEVKPGKRFAVSLRWILG
jgi:hypothetical protein